MIVAADGEATFAQLEEASLRVAAGLRARGVRPGDRVVVAAENTLASVTAILGARLAGATFVPVGPQTTPDRFDYIVADCEAALVVRGIDELLAHDPAEPAREAELAALVYTSGTTGVPKGVMLTRDGLDFAIGSIAEYLQIRADDRILSVLPIAFTYGLSQLLLSLRTGATLLLERSFAYPARTLERIERDGATIVPAVPTIFATIAAMESRPLASVRCLTNAAAGLPPALHDPIRAAFPNARLYRMYGQTECIRACYLDPELVDAKPSSVGRAIPGTEAFLLDAEGRRVGPGEVGTLHVRGPHVMAGYWQQPELTAAALPEPGLLCTGDLFAVDADGDLTFVARSDEMIKTRGEKVSPVEVEDVLHGISGVREAAVVGVAHELLGEAIRAYVVRCGPLTERDVIRRCRERLALHAVPQEVVFVDDLPKTDSGKVRRRSLAA